MPAAPRRTVAIGLRASRNRTERRAAVDDAITTSWVCAVAHSRGSGVTHVIVGRFTTVMLPEAKAVFGRSSSPTESTFFASWKSAAEAWSCSLPAFSAGASARQWEDRDAGDRVVRRSGDERLAVADHE